MAETLVAHMHSDLEELKQSVAVIMHILSEEGKLTGFAKKLLAESRATPDSEYVSQEELKRKILK